MELGQLEAFERVYREGSFTRAADALNLTQPSVSARIGQLEAELGGPLFTRGGRKLKLTALGRRFLPYAQRALAVLTDGLQEVRSLQAGRAGQVTVAAINTMGVDLLPDPLARFMREYPAVDVLVRRASPAEIIDQLYDGTVALGLLGAPLFDRGLHILAHFQEEILPVVAPGHPLARLQAERGSLKLADIYPHTVFNVALHPSATAFVRDVVETSRREAGRAMITLPAVMINRLALQGEGVAFLPVSRMQYHVDEGRLVYLRIDDMPRLFNEPLLVALRDRELDHPSAEFVRMIKAQWRHILIG